MYKIGICDDGNNMCSFIENTVLRYVKEKNILADIQVWYSGESLCKYLEQGKSLDILFLDIELIELSGIDVGEFIRNRLKDRTMQIIYISGNQSYAQRLFKTQPMDFLVKPIKESQIEECLQLACEIMEINEKKFEFQFGKEYYHVPYGEIIYFASEGRQIKIMTTHGEKKFYGKLKDIKNELTKDFIEIHQSYVVNKKYIWQYTYDAVKLENEEILNISHVHRKQVRERLLKEGW